MMDSGKKIIGRWVDVRNNSSNFYKIIDFFKFNENRFLTIIRNLELSVEQGIIEYKYSSLLPVFRLLEDLKYKAVTLPDLKLRQQSLDELLFVILIQRLFISGSLKITDPSQKGGISVETIEIKTILRDILSRIKEDPGLRNHPAFQRLLKEIKSSL